MINNGKIILAITITALVFIYVPFLKYAIDLYHQLPTLANAAIWPIYIIIKYSLYVTVITGVVWLLLILFGVFCLIKAINVTYK